MSANQEESDGATRVAYILGVPLADNVVRQWPQMGEIVRTSGLVADVEGNFPELTLEVGRRLQLDDVVVVEWTCDYGDGRLYRNVTNRRTGGRRSRAGHRLLGRAHRDTRMAQAADRSTRDARRRHLAGRRAPGPPLDPASGASRFSSRAASAGVRLMLIPGWLERDYLLITIDTTLLGGRHRHSNGPAGGRRRMARATRPSH